MFTKPKQEKWYSKEEGDREWNKTMFASVAYCNYVTLMVVNTYGSVQSSNILQ